MRPLLLAISSVLLLVLSFAKRPDIKHGNGNESGNARFSFSFLFGRGGTCGADFFRTFVFSVFFSVSVALVFPFENRANHRDGQSGRRGEVMRSRTEKVSQSALRHGGSLGVCLRSMWLSMRFSGLGFGDVTTRGGTGMVQKIRVLKILREFGPLIGNYAVFWFRV